MLLARFASQVGAAEGSAPAGSLLSDLGTESVPGGVQVCWQTTSETYVLGFDFLRRVYGGQYLRLNQGFIDARHAGSDQGADCSFLDSGVIPGLAYEYVLAVTLANGADVFHELPQVRANWWVQMPLTMH